MSISSIGFGCLASEKLKSFVTLVERQQTIGVAVGSAKEKKILRGAQMSEEIAGCTAPRAVSATAVVQLRVDMCNV